MRTDWSDRRRVVQPVQPKQKNVDKDQRIE